MDGKRLRELRKEKGLTQLALAELLNVDFTLIGKWELYDVTPNPDTLNKLANLFCTTTDYLLGRTDSPRPKTENEIEAELMAKIGAIPLSEINKYPIPIIGIAAAGNPILAVEDIEGYIYIDYPNADEYFAVRVRGDSMINAGIFDKSIVIIHRQSDADSGQIVLAIIDDEATIKRYKITQQGLKMLKPENEKYEPIIITENMSFRILGIVKEARSHF
ncbi:MAG: helix-turn-helix domain-containing protein [Clostridiales bacterium]|jgi:repressor LexA|nr:helix-turn-helix domain-containing protein [Clostridiales bacterium]